MMCTKQVYIYLFYISYQGLRPAWDSRTDREGRDALEFATAMFTYNRGLFGNIDLSSVYLLII